MATREPQASSQSKNKSKTNSKSKNARGDGGQRSTAAQGKSQRDDTYGLISIIYHASQGAETCTQYIEDARGAGHDSLASFFEECREEQRRRALLGRRLLTTELADMEEEVDDMVEADDNS